MSQLYQKIKNVIQDMGEAKDITELNLEDIKFQKFDDESTKLLQTCTNVNFLSLIGCGLISLKGMPKLNLQALDLSSNNISDEELKNLRQYTGLIQLSLKENQIKSFDAIKTNLSGCKNMEELEFSNNPVEKESGFRKFIFDTFSKLEVLDGRDKKGNEVINEPQEDSQQYEQDQEEYEQEQDDDDDYEEQSEEQIKPKKKRK